MSKIRKVIPGKKLPFTTVDEALKFGNRKVREAQTLRSEQLRIQENMIAAGRTEQGSVLEPFNFTKVLQKLFTRKKEEKAVERGNDPARYEKGDTLRESKDMEETSKTDTKTGKIREVQEEKEVRIDEQGTVVEEKTPATGAVAKEGKHTEGPKKTVKTVAAGPIAPSIDNIATPLNSREEKEYGNIVPTNVRSPQELRLGRGLKKTIPEAVRGQGIKSEETRVSTNNIADAYKDSPAPETEKEPAQREPGKVMIETAYKTAPQKIIEEQNRTPQEKQAEKRIETETTKVLVKTAAAVTAVARAAELNDQGENKKVENIKTDQTQTQRPQQAESSASIEQTKELPPPALEKIDLGGLLMKAAAITHVSGRELQFDKGRDMMQIKKEGNETFAYINGRKAGMDEAKEYMKDLGKALGPEKTQRLAVMISNVARTPNMTMEQALVGKDPAAGINQQIKEKGLEVPVR